VLAVEDRVRKLENKVALLVSVADAEKYPFICACLDADLDSYNVDRILALVTRVENSLNTSNSIGYFEFERELLEIVPSKKDNVEFAKVIIRALNSENKFILVTTKYKEAGIEI